MPVIGALAADGSAHADVSTRQAAGDGAEVLGDAREVVGVADVPAAVLAGGAVEAAVDGTAVVGGEDVASEQAATDVEATTAASATAHRRTGHLASVMGRWSRAAMAAQT